MLEAQGALILLDQFVMSVLLDLSLVLCEVGVVLDLFLLQLVLSLHHLLSLPFADVMGQFSLVLLPFLVLELLYSLLLCLEELGDLVCRCLFALFLSMHLSDLKDTVVLDLLPDVVDVLLFGRQEGVQVRVVHVKASAVHLGPLLLLLVFGLFSLGHLTLELLQVVVLGHLVVVVVVVFIIEGLLADRHDIHTSFLFLLVLERDMLEFHLFLESVLVVLCLLVLD